MFRVNFTHPMSNDNKSSANTTPASLQSASSRMVELLRELTTGEGFTLSRLDSVQFLRLSYYNARTPMIYEPCIFIMAQGRKIGRFGDRSHIYDPNHYLTLTLPVPFECETFGTPEKPALGFAVSVTPALVTELLLQMDRPDAPADVAPLVMEATPLDDELASAAVRLLECLHSNERARILGPALVREIVYLVLLRRPAANLHALATHHAQFSRIVNVINRLHADCSQPVEVEALAREAGMSVSGFHAHFKAVTATSPLQYMKAIRLHKARVLMVNGGATAAEAAGRVGYESVPQFSREFRRFFDESPAASAARLRAAITQNGKTDNRITLAFETARAKGATARRKKKTESPTMQKSPKTQSRRKQ
jgi:AraC-like DNA-binding protein